MNRVRCFVAIGLDPPTATAIRDAKTAIVASDPSWAGEKWVAPENLHITLKFLGSLPETQLPHFAEELASSLTCRATFELAPIGVVAKPSERRCSMIWTAFADPDGGFHDLAETLDALAARYGVERGPHTQSPHVTLVRARKPQPVISEAVAAASRCVFDTGVPMSVSCATLFSSTLTHDGPLYGVISVARFSTGEGV